MRRQLDIEDRIFELFGEAGLMNSERVTIVVREYGVTRSEAWDALTKVFEERRTPNLVAIRAAIERMGESIALIRR